MITADLLGTIVAATRKAVDVRRERRDEREPDRSTRRPRGAAFVAALRESPEPRVIAECKRRSPSRGILRADYDPSVIAARYVQAGAAAISVLTEPTFFDGLPDHLQQVRPAVDAPLLRKDFIVTEYQVHEAASLGADAVLLIVAALEQSELRRLLGLADALGLAALVEVHDQDELRRAADAGASVVGVNSRNLRTLAMDGGLHERIAAALPHGLTAVAESGLRTRSDLVRLSACGYHAFLVGERLISQTDPGAALEELRCG